MDALGIHLCFLPVYIYTPFAIVALLDGKRATVLHRVVFVIFLYALIFLTTCTTIVKVPAGEVIPGERLRARIILPSVRVDVFSQDMRRRGSGVIVARKGELYYYVLTASHVTNQPCDTLAVYSEYNGIAYTAKVVDFDGGVDIALLQITSFQALPVAEIAACEPEVLSPCYLYGYGTAEGAIATKGIVSNKKDPIFGPSNWTVTSQTWFGCSGGGVFDSEGGLFGICTRLHREKGQFLGWLVGAVKLPLIRKFLDSNEVSYALCVAREEKGERGGGSDEK